MTERILVQIVVCFLLGIFCAGFEGIGPAAAGGLAALSFAACMCVCGRGKTAYTAVVLRLVSCLLAYLLGGALYDGQQNQIGAVEAYLAENQEALAEGVIYKKEEKNQKIIYHLKNSYFIQQTGRIYAGQILIIQAADTCSIGDTIQVKGYCEGFRQARNEGNFDEKEYYYSRGIFCRILAESITRKKEAVFLGQEKLYRLRKRLQQVYLGQLPQTEAGILSVMTLGDKGFLEPEIKKLYQQSGISHVLAISGLHVSILGMGVYRFLRKRNQSYLCAGLTAGVLVFCFGQISGMELSAKRAIIMFLVMLLANVLGMAYDSVTALSLSALLQLWVCPKSLWYAGFLFSYGAVLAVVAAAKIIGEFWQSREQEKKKGGREGRGLLKRCLAALGGTFFISACIQLVTLPMTLYYYYEFPLYGIVVNGLLLPLMSLLLVLGILGGIVGSVNGFAGALLLKPAYLILKWNEGVCSAFAGLPGAVQITGQPPLAMLWGYYAILLFILALMCTGGGRKGVGRKTVLTLTPVLALALLVCLRPAKAFQVCFLDVGQGDGIFIQSQEGAAFFIDGGSTSESRVGEYRILSFLKYRGIRRIDGWFVSHADQDHISGLLELWESGYRIERLLLASDMVRDEAWETLCGAAKRYKTAIVYLEPGARAGTPTLGLTCLYPWKEGRDRNENSMVLKLECQGITGIFTGDIGTAGEQELARAYPQLGADLYKAAHHGSNGSNCQELLTQLKPKAAVVSCGIDNSYGHPGTEAVERINACGSRIFYTMDSGQLTFGSRNGQLWYEALLEIREDAAK